MVKLKQWSAVQARTKWDTLVLGNGASIAVFNKFDYKSLYAVAIKHKLVDSGVKRIFDEWKTKDFELVLENLWHAHIVNQLLDPEHDLAGESYVALRDALIAAVKEVHPEHADVSQYFDQMAQFMKQFKTVHCLNYDLTAYWAMMHWINLPGNNRDDFQDGLFHKGFPDSPNDWAQSKATTRVVYPHGSLILASNQYGDEAKISAGSGRLLLDTISLRWKEGELIPMFVSEGTSPQKRKNIERSHYLRAISRDYLADCTNIVFYGWSLQEKDQHLVQGMLSGRQVKRIAVGIYPNRRPADEIVDECEAMSRMILDSLPERANPPEIEFFDSTSKGCWIY